MLHQNWFFGKNMVIVDEYFDTQIFFDIESRCFYLLTSDKTNDEDVLVMKEISEEYAPARYKKYWEAYGELISTKVKEMANALLASIGENKPSVHFLRVEPIYTGGNSYCFIGQTDTGYFLATDAEYDIRMVNTNPWLAPHWDKIWEYDWQKKHIVQDVLHKDALVFFEAMLKWIMTNRPDGNYDMNDILARLQDVQSLIASGNLN